MRTTVSIEDSLLEQARKEALARRCSLGDIVNEALRLSLLRPGRDRGAVRARPLKTFKGTGTLPGVDLGSSSALLDLMEDR